MTSIIVNLIHIFKLFKYNKKLHTQTNHFRVYFFLILFIYLLLLHLFFFFFNGFSNLRQEEHTHKKKKKKKVIKCEKRNGGEFAS
jgi:hypothetical protein